MSGFIPEEQKQQQEKRKRRSKFACNTKEHIQARSQRLYSRQLEGKTTRQLVLNSITITNKLPSLGGAPKPSL
mgnify:CR=1 FL=1